MPNNWKKYKLTELGILARGKSKHRPRDASFLYGGAYPFIQTGDIKNANHRIFSYTQTYSEAGLHQSKLWPKDTLCITIAANIADTAILNFEACFPDSVLGFIGDKSICDIEFIEYLLQHYKKEIQSHSIGSVQDNINLGTFERVEFNIPPLPEQQAIAEILSSLDDKIELNLQTNKTLEEMANALYKHWFVDFGPFKNGKFINSELGMIPEGWEIKDLKDIAEIIMGQSPESKYYNEKNEGYPFHQGVSDFGLRFPTDRIFSTEGNRIAEKSDILFSVRAPVGKINIAKHKIILGRGLSAIRDKSGNNNFLFYSLKNQFKTIDSIGSGTVYNSVNKSDMEKIKILSPVIKEKTLFNDKVKDLDGQYLINDKENILLNQTRDYLLPKLISGQIRVKDVLKQKFLKDFASPNK